MKNGVLLFGPVLLMGTLLTGCNSDDAADAAPIDITFQVINPKIFPTAPYGGVGAVQKTEIFTTQIALDSKATNFTLADGSAFSANWNTSQVVYLQDTTFSTGGFSIGIKGVSDLGSQTKVTILHRAPGAGCMTTQSFMTPFSFYAIDSRKPLVFENLYETYNCN